MKTKSQDRLLKIILGLVSICWVIGIIVCILWIVSAVVLVILGGDHFRMLTTNMLETLFKGPYLSVSFTDPISFTGSPNIFILYCLEKVVVVFSFMFIIFNLRKILKKLVDRSFLIAESIRRVKIIGYTFVAGAFASGFMASIFSFLMARDIEIPGVSVTFYYGIHLPMVFLGAIILVIADVFRKGFEMQENQKFTVQLGFIKTWPTKWYNWLSYMYRLKGMLVFNFIPVMPIPSASSRMSGSIYSS